MAARHYDIIYQGPLTGVDAASTVVRFAALFKLSESQAQQLLAAKKTVLKTALDQTMAEHYRQKLAAIAVSVTIAETAVDEIDQWLTLEPETDLELESRSDPDLGSGSSPEFEFEAKPEIETKLQPKQENAALAKVATIDDHVVSLIGSQDEQWSGERVGHATEPLSLLQQQSPRASTNFALIEDGSIVKRLQFSFSGSGRALFRLWIVDVLWTVLSLGLYWPWAVANSRRYLYSHCHFEGAGFSYQGKPRQSLLATLIVAAAIIIAGGLLRALPPYSYGLAGLTLPVLALWLRGQYRCDRKARGYQQIGFGFDGSIGGALRVASGWLLVVLTLGIALPLAVFWQLRYAIVHSRFGVDSFNSSFTLASVGAIFIRALAGVVVAALLLVGVFQARPELAIALALVALIALRSYLQAALVNLQWDNSSLGDHRFSSSLTFASLFKLHLTNAVAMALTLGLFWPWAKVRLARYRAQNLLLLAQGRWSNYLSVQREDSAALAAVENERA